MLEKKDVNRKVRLKLFCESEAQGDFTFILLERMACDESF